MPKTRSASTDSSKDAEDTEDFKKKFGDLPLDKKMATLMQLEAATMSEAVNKIVDKSIAAGENVMERLTSRSRLSKGNKKSK